MTTAWQQTLLSPCLLVVLLFGWKWTKGATPEQLLQEGRAAAARGDYERAVALYERAEVRSHDPAEIAFYLAGAKYHLATKVDGISAELLEAEQLYRCCLDLSNPHRPYALCGLGNCLVRKAGAVDEGSLRAALACYERCLQEAGDDNQLADDARYNREKARLLLLQFQPPPDVPSGERPHGDDFNPQLPRFDPRQAMPMPASEPGKDGNSDAQPADGDAKADPGKDSAKNNEPTQPGKGNLPPIPDDLDAPPLPPHVAAEYLQRAAKKVLHERQMHQRRGEESSTQGVKDW